jgi:FlaA1/EpsC-like NDP-sugar epimerase
MLRKFVESIAKRFASMWVILGMDLCIVAMSFIASYYIRFNFEVGPKEWMNMDLQLPYILGIYSVSIFFFRSFANIIRHTTLADIMNIFKAVAMASAIALGLVLLARSIQMEILNFLNVPISILLISFLINLFMLSFSRILIKSFYRNLSRRTGSKVRVLIYGAGELGQITKNTLLYDSALNAQVVGFIDDNQHIIGKSISGIRVYSPKEAFREGFLERKKVQEVILAIQSIDSKRRKRIFDLCLSRKLKIRHVPPAKDWINGVLSAKQIKQVNIEDLLERAPISLDNENIKNEIRGQVILVTGAAGSIGSELSRQLLHYNPQKVILLDQAESPLYELEFELKQKGVSCELFQLVVADICNTKRIQRLFETFKPKVVFHAAAYKHVPMMEHHPDEAVSVNVLGTKTLADLAVQHGVRKFVMISTDKAVNPTNVMGATKSVAEIYTQSLNNLQGHKTQFITSRFGNVLGSNGSVIPLFKKQIEAGGPVTVTSSEITRYFMTIPEACQLVLEAGVMGQGGEIFIFDMGESVKIIDIAKKMIKLSGLEPGKDIQIKITGLRPGEKLYEELLNNKENTLPTHHDKIMIAKVRKYDFLKINKDLEDLKNLVEEGSLPDIVAKLKQILPEFKSRNSVYEALDVQPHAVKVYS